MTEEEIKANKWTRELTDDSVPLYLRTNYREPSHVEVRIHLELRGWSDIVSWIMPDEHSKVNYMALRGVTLVELDDAVKYDWVDA